MPKDYASLTEPRRKDRAITDETWIVDFLQRTPMGFLAMAHDGQPFINSNLFVYDPAEHCIFMHTAGTGRTRTTLASAEKVCFTAVEMGRLLPADEAKEFSVEYTGVMIFGQGRILEDADAKRYGLECLMEKYFSHLKPGEDYRAITREELKITSVYRIDINQWSAKRKSVEDDFPGAFYYDA